MDDFYDTDIGVQTSDILVLPSAFLGTLWTELQNLGNDHCPDWGKRQSPFKEPKRASGPHCRRQNELSLINI